MSSLRRIVAVAAVAGLAAVPAGASAAGVTCPSVNVGTAASAKAFGPFDSGRMLMVTFDDVPVREVAAKRLAGLGTLVTLLPEAGVWGLRATDPARVRSRALRRAAVFDAEWSLPHRTMALTDPPAPPPLTQPLQVLPEPADPLYADALKSWHLRTGNWTIGMSAQTRPIIAVLDSGLDLTHPEWSSPGLVVSPYNVFSGGVQRTDVSAEGHGTHVAGIVGAPVNGLGVVGVAPASTSSPILPVRITDRFGISCDASMIAGIRWAVQRGAKVINISSGGEGATGTFQTVINWAFGHGALVIASVGNEGLPSSAGGDQEFNPLNFPAAYNHVIGVAAQCSAVVQRSIGCDAPHRRARFSNFNASVDLVAPGVDIPSTIPARIDPEGLPTGYGLKSGTSMAAPYVAGVAALVYAAHPGISPFQVTRILEETATRGVAGLPRTSSEGWGVVRPLAAVQAQARTDDLAEPNDDTTPKMKTLTLRPGITPSVLRAWADANDDPIDVYGVSLRKGERLKVTLSATRGKLRAFVFRPGIRSLNELTQAQVRVKLAGATRRPTPGSRAVVIRAATTGRHWITVVAGVGGGDYGLKIQRLS